MYCSKCGKKNHDAAIFCERCGADLPDMLERHKKTKGDNSVEQPPWPGVKAHEEAKISTDDNNSNVNAVVTSSKPKSTDNALVATILLGPIGLFYVTSVGGVVMLVLLLISVLMAILETISFPVFLNLLIAQWVICLVWRSVAVKHHEQSSVRREDGSGKSQ
ncbi:MAG: zinc ribbon domain-containing protein [Burkholderiaceae bacterium]|nr:zinc ribbon domain-containing protein [Burkholderiaceae bacterium]